jgi:serine/threonine protein kinase/Tol biopolymer transport system component
MQDLIGTTLGHYRIVEQIGAGGMGVVYRAQDERLDRDVAIKVIHEAVAQDADRLARFEREAKAVAKLDHPNILAIYDFGTDHGVTYAVTELLDGQNLRHGIPASGLPWQKVVEMGAAIADGLAAAHGKGIVHRDLKPENVFVTSDGRVKVLDFGLAQVKAPVEEEAETATMTPAGTVAGTVMGTMGYMSPEQLRGERSDARSDIFALGCVLYEMLSGRTAFLRNSTAETSAAILKEEPPSLSDSGTTLPTELDRAIRRCLEKSPEARFQSAADLAYNLRSIGTGSAVPVMAASSDQTPVAAGSTKRAFRRYALMAIGLIIALVASWWALTQLGSDESAQAPSFQSMTITPVTSLGTVRGVGISPDGRQLAYLRDEAGERSIWVRQVATGSEVEVVPPNDPGISAVEFAPDGEYLLFRRWDSPDSPELHSIFRVPTLGGEVRRIVFDADGLPSFSPDGQRFAFRRGIPGRGVALMVADADGSGERELAIGDGMGSPAWSPDGRTIAAMLWSPEGWRPFAFDVDTGAREVIAEDLLFKPYFGFAWLREGDELIVAGSIPSDTARSQIWHLSTVEGTLERITNDPNRYRGISLSADGTVLATVLVQSVGHLYVAPSDDPDSIRQLTHGSRERVFAVDADGSSVVFQRTPEGQKWELWACDHDGKDLRRLNTDGSEVVPGRSGVSAVDGEILFTAMGPDSLLHIWKIGDDRNPPLQLTATPKSAYGPSLAPDGEWFVYTLTGNVGLGPMSSAGVWRQPAGGGDPVLLSANGELAAISPDGEHVAIEVWREDDQGDSASFLEVVPTGGGAPVISIGSKGALAIRWQPEGQALSYLIDDQVWLQPLDGKPPEQLTLLGHGRTISHAWSPDGKWLFLVREEVTRDVVLIRDF